MASKWTVQPDSEKFDLVYVDEAGVKHSFWIKLKKLLNVGENRKVATAGWRSVSAASVGKDAEINIDWQTQMFARVVEYLLDWSLTDDDAVKLPATRESIEALHEDVYKAIEAAVTAHVEAMEAAKKTRAGGSVPSATSA